MVRDLHRADVDLEDEVRVRVVVSERGRPGVVFGGGAWLLVCTRDRELVGKEQRLAGSSQLLTRRSLYLGHRSEECSDRNDKECQEGIWASEHRGGKKAQSYWL